MRAWVLLLLLAAPAVAEPHGPIRIVSDLDFQDPRTGVSSGSGTPDDPFIIEGFEIRPQLLPLSPFATAIHIEGTEAHVMLRDITVDQEFGAAIRVLGAVNVTLQDIHLQDQVQALWADEVRDLRIEGLSIEGSRGLEPFGVLVTDSHRVHLRGIDIQEGGGPGLQVTNSRFVRIEGATVRAHEDGIRLQGSQDVALVSVTSAHNAGDGLWMRNLTRFEALDVTAHGQVADAGSNSGRGIVAWNVGGSIHDVAAVGNAAVGMLVLEGRLSIADGRFLENGGVGLHAEAVRTDIQGIEAHGNRKQGIAVFGQDGGVMSARTLRIHDNGGAGLYAQGLDRMVLLDARSETNEGAGVLLRDGANLTFTGGFLRGNEEGLLLANVRGGEVRDVVANDNDVGVRLYEVADLRLRNNEANTNGGDGFDVAGQDIRLVENRATGNLGFGIRVRDGANATLAGNIVTDNARGDLSEGVLQRESPGPWLVPALLLGLALRVLHQRP